MRTGRLWALAGEGCDVDAVDIVDDDVAGADTVHLVVRELTNHGGSRHLDARREHNVAEVHLPQNSQRRIND